MALPEREHLLEDENVRPDDYGEELARASQAQHQAGQRDLRPVRRARRNEQALLQGNIARTVALMETVARTERAIADTLRAMARADGSEAAARRLRLAEAAVNGAHQATEYGERLQRLADRWARHAAVTALRRSLSHADTVLADLASTEEDIAGILTKLASKDDSDLARERRHLADEALANARVARDRARALWRLAESAASGLSPGRPGREREQREMTVRRELRRDSRTRDRAAEDRDKAAEARDRAAEAQDQESAARDAAARTRDETAILRDRAMRERLRAAAARQDAADQRQAAAGDRDAAVILLEEVRQDRRAAAADRSAAARDREAAARDREGAAADRQQAAVERAEVRIPSA